MRILNSCIALVFGLLFTTTASFAYPDHPVKVIVPFGVGTSVDAATRIVFDKVSKRLGQPFVIENRPGSFGEIGIGDLLQSAPDGYTLVSSPDGPMSTVPADYVARGMHGPYDPTLFVPVGQIAESYFVLILRKDFPTEDVQGLITYGKTHPGTLTFFSSNPSGTLGIGLLNQRGAGIIEDRNFPGGEPLGHQGVLSGIDQGMFSTTFTAKPLLSDGSEKSLGSMGPARSPFLPELKTLDEQGFHEFNELTTWNAVFAPPGTSEEIVRVLNQAITEALQELEVREKFAAIGLSAVSSTPAQLGALVVKQIRTLTEVIRATGVKLKS